ncbi:unnamed protein product [Rotaria sp. Silwood1]|nr:unnamed protein product [Rotaria sp. Silwood1]CAF4719783.1 unnamed protein product [Rotaria sp. Silwood1]
MEYASYKRHQQPTSLVETRLQEFTTQLDNFFKHSNQSSEILNALFEQYCPSSSSIYESIIYVYSNSLNKPKVNKLLNKTIEYLHLNNDENLLKTSYYLKELKFNEQTEQCNLLHNAIIKNYENIFQLLLKSGFNPNSLLSDRKTPLSICVVTNTIDPRKRLEYIQLLIEHGANPIIQDVNNSSPFKRLCGMESNYPIVYNFFRDYLLSVYPEQIEFEFNDGLQNGLYNFCVPIVIDLLEHGAISNAFKTIDSFEYFLSQMASTIFKERRSISHIDPFILCLIQIILHHIPCENYSICIQKFFQLIYIPGVCFETNNDPCNHPSMTNVKKLLYVSFHYGYLTKIIANKIRTNDLSKILTMSMQNSLILQTKRRQLIDTLNQYFDELTMIYHENPLSLKLFSIRKIRQSMIKLNQKNIEQLNISRHLKNSLLLKQ